MTHLKGDCTLQLHNNNLGLKQLSTTIISLITKALEYKAALKFEKQFVYIAMHFLVMSPCSYDFLLMSLHMYLIMPNKNTLQL